jgi:threonine dehydrogenase-like Zn-dependent dehydrogenase
MGKDTMKAVVFKGPQKVVIEDRSIPKIQDPTDIIVKVDKVSTLSRFVGTS